MTEPENPRPPDAKAPPAEHHHGLAEEIAEVVEHVPKPVRWTVGKLVWLTVAGFVALLLVIAISGALYLAHRTEWVAQEITLFLNQTLSRNSDVVLEMRDIQGNPLTGFVVTRPRVRFRDSGTPLLEAPSMRVTYSAWGFVLGKQRAVDVQIDRPVLRFARGPDGKIRLPKWRGGPASKAPGASVRVRLVLREAEVLLPDRQSIAGGRLDMLLTTAPTRIEIADLGWRLGLFGTRLDRLRGAFATGDSITFRVDELRSPEVSLTAHGGWKSGHPGRSVHAEVHGVEWRLLSRIFGNNHDLDVSGRGDVVIDATGEQDWLGSVRASVVWDSLPGEVEGRFSWHAGKLNATPVELHSPAGHLRGHVMWATSGWEVGGAVEHGDPSRWRPMHVTGWPAGDVQGTFLYRADSRPHRSNRLDARLGASQLAGWNADSAEVSADFCEDLPDSFTVHMLRRGGRGMLHGRINDQGWTGVYQLAQLPLEEWPEGREGGIHGVLSEGSGTVESREGGLYVTGSLAGVTTDWLGIHTAGWTFREMSGALLPKPDLEGAVRLSNLMYLGVHFDSAAVQLHVTDQRVALEHVRALAGDTLLSTAGRAEWNSAGWGVTLERAEAISRQFHWSVEPPIALRGNSKGVTFDRLFAHDGEAHLSISGRWAAPGGDPCDWNLRGDRLDLSRLGLPVDLELSGHLNATLEVHGRPGDERWTFEASASHPGYRGHRADSLHLEVAGAPATLDLRDFTYHLKGGVIAGRGRAERMARTWPESLTAASVQRWISDAGHWDGAFSAKDVPVNRLGQFAPAAEGLAGRLSGSATLGGRPGQPEIDVRASLDSAAWHDYRVDGVQLHASYHDLLLDVPEIRVTRRNVVSRISGHMPLTLALGRRPDVLETPMAWTVEVPNGDLTLVPVFVPQIGSASGKFDLTARLGGTWHHPDLDGAIHVREGVIRLAAREEVLDHVYADLHIAPSRITVDTLSARQGQHGRVWARGAVALTGLALKGYSFDLEMRDFAAVDEGLYAAEFDGKFVVTNGLRINHQTLPMVVGKANLRRAVILFDFTNQSEMQQIAAATQPLFWTYRVQVVAVNNLHWRPPEGDIEFSADLNLEQTRDSLLIYGDMTSLRGTYWFLSNRFNVVRANLTFDNVGGMNPVLDAEATTRLAPTQGEDLPGGSPDNQDHMVTVRITGRANEPVIELLDDTKEEDKKWDQATILRELTLGQFGDLSKGPSLASTVGDPLDNYLTRAINKSLSADLSRVFGNYITEWSLERERGGLLRGEGDVIVSAGGQLTKNLSVKYSQVVGGPGRQPTTALNTTNPFERDVEAEYRINRFFYVTTEVAQKRVGVGTTSNSTAPPDFNVNLKARWEY